LTFQLLRTSNVPSSLFLLVNSFLLYFAISEVPDGLINHLDFYSSVKFSRYNEGRAFKTKHNLSKCASTEVYGLSSQSMSP